MKKDILKNYIEKITKEDIENFISKECITASNEEIDTLYNIIKYDNEKVLETDFMTYISNYKTKFNPELYKTIIEKYNKYKKFIE